jgi:hypothetical protein
MTWESQRSADAICDRAEIMHRSFFAWTGRPVQAGNVSLAVLIRAPKTIRELCLADEEKGLQVTGF